MSVALIQVPYHLGQKGVGMATGVPVLAEALAGQAGDLVEVDRGRAYSNEVSASMDVVRALAERVGEVVARGEFPIVLAANCGSCLGTVAGLQADVGVVWLDAHADFNTPETTTTGFFDGMALAMLTGSGWSALRATVPGLVAVPEERVVLLGARAFDPSEEERFRGSAVHRVSPNDLPGALDRLREHVDGVYVHVDLDVLDPSVGRANVFAEDGGLSVDEVAAAVDEVAARFAIRAAALTAYQPDCDPERAIPPAARTIVERIVAGVRATVTAG